MISADQLPSSRIEDLDNQLGFPQRIALIDEQGVIVAVNKDWIALAKETGAAWNRVGPGANYFDVCRQNSGTCPTSRKALSGIREVLEERAPFFGMDYSCHTVSTPRYFRMAVTPIAFKNARVSIAHTDITDLHVSKENDFKRLQDFARRLIHAQEEERRRISREIHDDLGSRLALMSLSVHRVMNKASGDLDSGVHELAKILDGITDLSAVLRNLSHGLRPAALRYLGIGAALKSLLNGFKQTYPLQMDVVIPQEMPRLPDEVELCIFRITQECLQNVVKHSGASQVKIALAHSPSEVRLTVSDTGRGFNRSEAIRNGGIGLQSMEERVLGLRGRLTINSSPGAGTEVCLSIPIETGIATCSTD